MKLSVVPQKSNWNNNFDEDQCFKQKKWKTSLGRSNRERQGAFSFSSPADASFLVSNQFLESAINERRRQRASWRETHWRIQRVFGRIRTGFQESEDIRRVCVLHTIMPSTRTCIYTLASELSHHSSKALISYVYCRGRCK